MDDYDKMIVILEKHTHYSGSNIHDRTLQNINKELSEFLNSLIDTSIAKTDPSCIRINEQNS